LLSNQATRLEILYIHRPFIKLYISSDGSFPANPTDNKVQETPLLQVFNLDKLNYNNDRQTGGDGFFLSQA
jgi:hypothetical protein